YDPPDDDESKNTEETHERVPLFFFLLRRFLSAIREDVLGIQLLARGEDRQCADHQPRGKLKCDGVALAVANKRQREHRDERANVDGKIEDLKARVAKAVLAWSLLVVSLTQQGRDIRLYDAGSAGEQNKGHE